MYPVYSEVNERKITSALYIGVQRSETKASENGVLKREVFPKRWR